MVAVPDIFSGTQWRTRLAELKNARLVSARVVGSLWRMMCSDIAYGLQKTGM